jgi:hypothetical protein
MAHLPCYPAMLGGSALLMCGPSPPLAVSGVLCVLGAERVEAPSRPHTIPGIDFEWWLWFSLWYKMPRCRTAHLAISISNKLGQNSSFLATDLVARLTPLLATASGGDHGKRPWGRSPHHDGRQLPSRQARMDASFSQASPLVRWGFTLYWCLRGLASYCDTGLCLLIGVELHLLQMQWSSSCRVNFLPRRGSWIVGKAPSLCGRMDW